MLFTRVLLAAFGDTPRFARVDGHELHLLDGDPTRGPARETGERADAASATYVAPASPSKILAVGVNYRAHATEMGKPVPDEPVLFMKPPSALIGHGAAIVRPRGGYARVDFEGELCVVIGRRARHLDEANALDCVFGYTVCNDVTVRELQKKDVQFARAKGFDTFCPLGPVIATGLDPSNLRLKTRVNGVLKQDTSTADLVFSVPRLLAFASRVMTLEPGDLLSTGTPPGVGNLAAGDRVAITIEGIGTLENHVVDEPEPGARR